GTWGANMMRCDMKHIFPKTLAAAGMAAALGAMATPASADVVLTPYERVVVYRDLVAAPYPAAGGYYYDYDGYAYAAPAYTAPPDYYYQPEPRWDIRVGAVVPAAVPLQAVPPTLGVET